MRSRKGMPPCVGHNAKHYKYYLTCEEFDQLALRSEGRCDRCSEQLRLPNIDHDHEIGLHAPRGLLCSQCNSIVAAVDRGERDADQLSIAYLDDPFYLLIPSDEFRSRDEPGRCMDRRPRIDHHITWRSRENLLSPEQAGRILGMTADDVVAWANRGGLVGRPRRDGSWLFRPIVVDRAKLRRDRWGRNVEANA